MRSTSLSGKWTQLWKVTVRKSSQLHSQVLYEYIKSLYMHKFEIILSMGIVGPMGWKAGDNKESEKRNKLLIYMYKIFLKIWGL